MDDDVLGPLGSQERRQLERRSWRIVWTLSAAVSLGVVTCLFVGLRERGGTLNAASGSSWWGGLSGGMGKESEILELSQARITAGLSHGGLLKGHGGGESLAEEGRAEEGGSSGEGLGWFPPDMLSMMELEADPCEDPYEWACGKWDNETVIPDYTSAWTPSFDVADVSTMENMREVLQEDDGPAGTYYKACMNTSRIDELGARALWDTGLLQSIQGISNTDSLTDFLIQFSLAQDDGRPDQHMVSVSGGDLSLPERSYYLDQTDQMETHRQAFVAAVAKFFVLLGTYTDTAAAHEAALRVLHIETQIANITLPLDVSRTQEPIYIHLDKLTKWCPSIEWDRFFSGLNLSYIDNGDGSQQEGPHRRLAVYDPDYFSGLGALLESTSFDALKDYFTWVVAHKYAPMLSTEFVDTVLAWNKDLYGVHHISPRWKKCFYTVSRKLQQHISQLYISAFFPPVAKNAAESLLDGIRAQFLQDIGKVPWMNDATRTLAKAKLNKMLFSVGGPAVWEPRGPLLLDGDFLKDSIAISSARAARERASLLKAPSRTKWTMSSTTVNAYYDRNKNGLFIPAAILQPPFFNATFTEARNAGGIGTILGHEMTHGFDDQGRKYDGDGRLHKWWDTETAEEYDKRAECIADQYSTFTVAGGAHVNGKLTLGENIADSGGLKLAYYAWLSDAGSRDAAVYNVSVHEVKKVFFAAFAQNWCGVEKGVSEQAGVLSDVHAPRKWRVNGALANFKPFADTFSCKLGSKMNRAGGMCELW